MPEPASTQWVNRHCPLCAATATRPLWEKGALRVVTCAVCGCAFANPIAADFASGTFYDAIGATYYLSPQKLGGDYAPVRFERELRLFRAFCPRGAVLDVGCSTGGFLHQLVRLGGYEVTGLDVASEALTYAERQGIEVVRTPFLDHDFGARRFDAVTFWAVLEHLADPGAFLHRAATLVRPGGHCFVLVPNLRSLAIRVCGSKYRYVMPDHLNYFSAATLQALALREPGWQVLHVRTLHFNPVVIWQDLRRPQDRVPEDERAQLLERTTRLKQSSWLKPVRVLYRAAEAVLRGMGMADNLAIVLGRR